MILGEVPLLAYALVALVAFLAAIVGGVSGYGTGILLPPVLLAIVDPDSVVPIIALASLLTNASRLVAFRGALDKRLAAIVIVAALPSCLLGAYGYTRLSGAGVALLIGAILVLIVPLRRWLIRRRLRLGSRGMAGAGIGYGLLTGATSGAGVVLLSLLLSAGLGGQAVVATDAGISLVLGLAKVAVFFSAGALPPSTWIMAALIGLAATPGAFVARVIAKRLSAAAHAAVLDGVVILGGLLLVADGLRRLT